ncbi:dedicator of cytokinesis protein 1-like isoform X2 [Ptychodera flava]|uniref:dedicator of cytokinesis protein 1-like isoform X2 n=1 Tax=Ptychodera flava TaxID=63121 RepID=UPI003969C290
MTRWAPSTDAKFGVVLYNFWEERTHYLRLSVGDTVHVLEQNEEGWFFGYNTKNKNNKGIFPKSYILLREAKVENPGQKNECVTPLELPIVSELSSVLREWGLIWKQCYVDGMTENFEMLKGMMLDLVNLRRQIMSGTLPEEELKEIIQRVTSKIDYGNRILDLDLVVRDEDGGIIDPSMHSAIAVFKKHEIATQNIQRVESDPFKAKKQVVVHSYSFLVKLKNFVCFVGSDAELLMSLYDPTENKFISDNFIVRWPARGLPSNFDMLENCKVVFTDLGSKDLKRDKIYLVCQIIRIGKMEYKEGTSSGTAHNEKKFTQDLRRPFGVAAMEITDLIREKDTDYEKQHFVPFQQVTSDSEVLDSVIKKVINAREINARGQGLWVTMRLLHGDITQIVKDYAFLVDQRTAVARKMGFPEVIMPVDVRNDVYVTLNCGDFEFKGKTTPKNVEVTVKVCDKSGAPLERILTMGEGQQVTNELRSSVYYQVKNPKWNETVKVALPIDVPIEDLHGTHLKFTFRHRSSKESKDKDEKVFGLAYLKLLHENGTCVCNGVHDLVVYKIDSKMPAVTSAYLDLPSTKAELMQQNRTAVNRGGLTLSSKEKERDSFQVVTLVCSTKFPQNVDLLGLLKWRADSDFNIQKTLKTFMENVDGEEIVKFLRDTLESLFNIWMEHIETEDFDELIFDALVFVIQLIADKKYQHFGPVLDAYIKKHFSATLAYKKLMSVLNMYLNRADQKEKQEPLFKSLKALEYIFKFIVRSRVLYSQVLDRSIQGKQQFESEMRGLFQTINNMMKYTSTVDAILLCQGAAMKSLPIIVPVVLEVFDHKDLSILLKEFIENIPPDRLVRQKMICIDDLVHSKLFEIPESRGILLQVITKQLKPLLERKEENHICAQVLSDILELLYRKDVGPTHTDISILMKELLRTVIQTVIFMDRDSLLIGNFVACMIGLLRQMNEYHYQEYIANFHNRTDLVDFLMEIFMVFRDLVSKNVFPKDWSVMIMLQNSVTLSAMKHFSQTLNKNFISDQDFEYQLWNNFFHLAVAFLTQSPLQLEHFSTGKRTKIIEKYKDMRREVGIEIIHTMWNYLGRHKIRFIPEMVGPFLEVTLIPETELRKATIPIFFDMMQCEFNTRHNFKEVESEMITQLDVLVEGGRGDEQYKDLFNSIMSELCSKHQFLCNSGAEFVRLVIRLLERLLDYRAILTDENKENKMSCTVNLLNFYKEIEKQEMYLRYLYKLCDLHLECDNHTEAAFALHLHADRLKWSDDRLPFPLDKYPQATTQRQLKEALYYDIVQYFDKGKMWENGIKLCKELAKQYENELFDYVQLSQLLKRQAGFYDNIMRLPRPEPEYFRVGFYGQGFPLFLRNKLFIYRGKEYERLADFNSGLQNMYPTAKMMDKTTMPEKDILESKGQHLQICKVHPVEELNKKFKGKMVNDQILSYYKVNEVQKFVYSRPFFKEGKKNDNEFANMWIERTYHVTAYKLPGILRWFEVVSQHPEEMSPLQHAVEIMEEQNQMLRSLVKQYQVDTNLPLNPLSMKLNGVVDAAVMGGTDVYEKAFCTEEYLKGHPDDEFLVERLKDLIAEQIPIIAVGLKVHSIRAPPNLKPLQDKMELVFQKRKSIVELRYGKRPLDTGSSDRSSEVSIRRMNTVASSRPASTISSSSSGGSESAGARGSSGSFTQIDTAFSNPMQAPPPIPSRTPQSLSTRNTIVGTPKISPTKPQIAIPSPNVDTWSSTGNSPPGSSNKQLQRQTIVLEEKLQSARPPRPQLTPDKRMSLVQQPRQPLSTSPPPLPEKQCSDYSNLPDPIPIPPKTHKVSQSYRDKPGLPVPAKDSSGNTPPGRRRRNGYESPSFPKKLESSTSEDIPAMKANSSPTSLRRAETYHARTVVNTMQSRMSMSSVVTGASGQQVKVQAAVGDMIQNDVTPTNETDNHFPPETSTNL